jgi:hypothetical protein
MPYGATINICTRAPMMTAAGRDAAQAVLLEQSQRMLIVLKDAAAIELPAGRVLAHRATREFIAALKAAEATR